MRFNIYLTIRKATISLVQKIWILAWPSMRGAALIRSKLTRFVFRPGLGCHILPHLAAPAKLATEFVEAIPTTYKINKLFKEEVSLKYKFTCSTFTCSSRIILVSIIVDYRGHKKKSNPRFAYLPKIWSIFCCHVIFLNNTCKIFTKIVYDCLFFHKIQMMTFSCILIYGLSWNLGYE